MKRCGVFFFFFFFWSVLTFIFPCFSVLCSPSTFFFRVKAQNSADVSFYSYCLAFLVTFARCGKMKSYEKIIWWGYFSFNTAFEPLELLNLIAEN